ncbi:MAG: hypothetical protein RIS64_1640 [Bacteroidota bacterium]|jgi:hypothetical protein
MTLLQNVFLAIFLCITAQLTAQIPGYMGKRLVFDAEFQFMPVISTSTSDPNSEVGNSFHTRYGLGVGYALSRTQTLTAQLQYFRTGMSTDLLNKATNKRDYLFCKLSTIGLDVAYNVCRASRGDIAPIGRQVGYHFYVLQPSAKDDLYLSASKGVDRNYDVDPKGILFGVGYSVTYNKVVHDKFRIKYGWQINIPFSWGSEYFPSGTEQERFDNDLKYKFRYYNFLQFKVGFGLLN